MKARTLRRLALAAAATAVTVLLVAPYWNLDRYRRQIQAGLERELHRRVTVGKPRLLLLRGPGVTLTDVVIEDHPRAGKEPFAYVTALEARIALRSLWTGRLEFASLRLVEPSLNLVKPAGGSWNFTDLVRRPPELPASKGASAPSIAVRRGRINFKFGDTKSVLYLANADLDLYAPEGPQGVWQIRFTGEPARTDRPAQRLGKVAARGRLWPGKGLELDAELERSYLEEISTLLAGRDLGLRGSLTSRARLQGPMSELRLSGEAQFRDFRRWDLPTLLGADWRIEYAGTLDLPGQRLQLALSPAEQWPLKVLWDVNRFLEEPRWRMQLDLNEVPLASVMEALGVLGLTTPPNLRLSGAVSGQLAYQPASGWEGALAIREARAVLASGVELRCPQAPVVVRPAQIRLGPWKLEGPGAASLLLEGSLTAAPSQASLSLKAEQMPVAIGGAPFWPGLEPVPVLGGTAEGTWTGWLRYWRTPDGGGRWTGRFQVRDAKLRVAELARPLQVRQAQVELAGDQLVVRELRGAVGGIAVDARYSGRHSSPASAELKLHLGRLDLAELEQVLAPVLDRRRGLLDRALRRARAPTPSWLLHRRLEGEFDAEAVVLSGARVAGPVRGRFRWHGLQMTLVPLEARLEEAELRGRVEVDLQRPTPAYNVTAVAGPLETPSGRWWIEGWLQTEGLSEEVLGNLRAGGALLGRQVTFAPEEEFDLVAARFGLRYVRRLPRLTIEGLEAVQGDAIFRGQCRTDGEGRLNADLAHPHRRLRLEGTLWPLKLSLSQTP